MNEITQKRKPYPFRNGSQCDRLFRYLLSGNKIFNYEIREEFNILAHTRRISELRRKHGFNVMSREIGDGVWLHWLEADEIARIKREVEGV